MKKKNRIFWVCSVCLSVFLCIIPAFAAQDGENNVSGKSNSLTGWIQTGEGWYWLDAEGKVHTGWLFDNGRWYYLMADGTMAKGWKEIGQDWYYFHEDGGMNEGTLTLNTGVYEFEKNGALKSSHWIPGSGGGAYETGCFDEEEQALFDEMSEEKRQQYFDLHPGREEAFSGSSHTTFDRYAGFYVETELNRIADHRLKAAMEKGYTAENIPGEGTLKEYLDSLKKYRYSSLKELYIRDCEDAEEAWEKILKNMDRAYAQKEDRKDTLEYYRYLGMSHCEKDGRHWFMVLFMR